MALFRFLVLLCASLMLGAAPKALGAISLWDMDAYWDTALVTNPGGQFDFDFDILWDGEVLPAVLQNGRRLFGNKPAVQVYRAASKEAFLKLAAENKVRVKFVLAENPAGLLAKKLIVPGKTDKAATFSIKVSPKKP